MALTPSALPSALAFSLLDHVQECICCFTKEGQIIYCNRTALDFFSFSTLAAFQENFEMLFSSPTEAIQFQTYLQKALQEGQYAYDVTLKTEQHTSCPCHIAFTLTENDGQKYIICRIHTAEKATYLSHKDANIPAVSQNMNSFERMQILLKHLPIGADLWSKDFKLFDCNEATLHLFEAKDKADYLQNFRKFSPKYQPCGTLSSELIPLHLKKVFEEGHNSFEWMHVTASGKEVLMKINMVRTTYAGEDIAVVYYKDLRDINESIDVVLKTEQRLKDILNAAPYAINTWSKDFVPVDCNEATIHLYGFKDRNDYLQNFHKVIPEYQKDGRKMSEILVKRFTEAFQTGYAFDSGELINAKTGKLFPIEITLKRLLLDNEERVVTYMTDLSVQHEMMKEIQESHMELSLARDLAEKNARIKGEFLANMSHEIRTPMNGILGLLHLLSLTELGQQQKFYVDKIIYSAESLLRIINDILDFSKIEAGKMEMEHVSFSLEDIQEELRTLFAPKFAENNIQGCIFDENVLDTKLLGDPLRLKQVLLNLISNAIKFTHSGSVTAYVKDVKHETSSKICYTFCVEDTGIGLSEEQCSRIFSAFSQADTSTTRKYGGTGLGLIICKRIVEMMQGKIWVESTLGKGSKFHFSATFDVDMSTLTSASIEKTPLSTTQSSSAQGRILLVEDNEINQIIAQELIESQGHTVDVAGNGQIAIDMLEKNKYDMVFMDIQMPVMDGLTAARTLRKNPKYVHLPIIAMSAHAMTGDKEISLNNGMNDHISKPIDPQKLFSSITLWLNYTGQYKK